MEERVIRFRGPHIPHGTNDGNGVRDVARVSDGGVFCRTKFTTVDAVSDDIDTLTSEKTGVDEVVSECPGDTDDSGKVAPEYAGLYRCKAIPDRDIWKSMKGRYYRAPPAPV